MAKKEAAFNAGGKKKRRTPRAVSVPVTLPGWCTVSVLGLVARIGDTQYAAWKFLGNVYEIGAEHVRERGRPVALTVRWQW